MHKNSAVTDSLNAENTADTSTGEVVEEPQQSTTITSCICGEDCAYGDGCICSCKSKDSCKCLQCKNGSTLFMMIWKSFVTRGKWI